MLAFDRRTGMPASPDTPSEFIELRPADTPPPEPSPTQAQPTAAPAPATAASSGLSPSQGAGGAVVIRGTASSPNMQYYRLEYSLPGGGWSTIGQWTTPVTNGPLATWSTAGLPPGQYTLRLTVQDAVRGPIVSTVVVNISR
jgi:hypothetical protein